MADNNNTDQAMSFMDTDFPPFTSDGTGSTFIGSQHTNQSRQPQNGTSNTTSVTPGSKTGVTSKRKNLVVSTEAPRAKIKALEVRMKSYESFHAEEESYAEKHADKRGEAYDLLRTIVAMVRNPKQDKDRVKHVSDVIEQALAMLTEVEEVEKNIRLARRKRDYANETHISTLELRCISMDLATDELEGIKSYLKGLEDDVKTLEEEADELRRRLDASRERER